MKKEENTDTEKILEQAWKKFSKKDYDGATELFSTLPEEGDSHLEGLYGQASCMLRKKDYSTAIDLYDKLAEIQPDDFKIYHARALCCGGDEEYDQAIDDLEKAIELAGDRHDLYFDLGGTFLVTKDYKRAAQCFEKCIDIDNKCFEAWVGKALASYYNKELKAAYEFANIALKFNPKSLMALLLKMEVLMETGKKDDAGKEIKKVLAIDPDIFKPKVQQPADEHESDDYDIDEDANRSEDDEIEEFDLDD